MHVGLLTAPFGGRRIEDIIEWASDNGFKALEVASGPGAHLDPEDVAKDDGASVKNALEKHKMQISSLAMYANVTDGDAAARKTTIENLKRVIEAAALLDVEVVCTIAGMPAPGKSKMQTIEEDCREVFQEICDYAAEREIKIALENWFATNIQHLGHWERIFEVVPASNLGLNFDPSHLYWQQIDYIAAVEQFGDRIFHTHAKDCEVKQHRLRKLGVLEGGWWRYVIPGFGDIHWGEYIGALRGVKYDGVLSIEHEDGAVGAEFGFIKGREYLEQFV